MICSGHRPAGGMVVPCVSRLGLSGFGSQKTHCRYMRHCWSGACPHQQWRHARRKKARPSRAFLRLTGYLAQQRWLVVVSGHMPVWVGKAGAIRFATYAAPDGAAREAACAACSSVGHLALVACASGRAGESWASELFSPAAKRLRQEVSELHVVMAAPLWGW